VSLVTPLELLISATFDDWYCEYRKALPLQLTPRKSLSEQMTLVGKTGHGLGGILLLLGWK
jgi:hypothetical protein